MAFSNSRPTSFPRDWTQIARLPCGAARMAATFVCVALIVSCMLVSGCGGPTDSRLVGVWENRQGFSKSTRIKFAADGSMIVATKTEGQGSEQMKGSWYVVTPGGGERITIKVSLKGESRERSVKFLEQDLIEMSTAAKGGVRRYTRVPNK